MVKQGFTIENHRLIVDKAKTKRDGVFSFRGVSYRVRNGNVTHFAYGGTIYNFCHGFNVKVGQYKYMSSTSSKHALQTLIN